MKNELRSGSTQSQSGFLHTRTSEWTFKIMWNLEQFFIVWEEPSNALQNA